MGIRSIRIVNLLSFEELVINDFADINCIIGQNNAGKSNLLKLIKYFYVRLANKRELPPGLHSAYSGYGSISIAYDTSRIKKIVTSKKNNSNFLKHIYNVFFKSEANNCFDIRPKNKSIYELTLRINSNESTEWSTKDKNTRDILNFLFPFFEVETRHIDLYDWEKLWFIISKLKTFNVNKLQHDEVVKFFDSSISEDSKSYSDYIEKIDGIIDISKYSYREKVLNYIKVGLKGHTFMISGEELTFQSDGTNSYKYIELLLTLLITLTRREYITPTIYIDEPETGLHPKRNEELVHRLYEVYSAFKKTKDERELGKYKTPYPKIIFSTHSPNILKYVIKLFGLNQQILHFSKKENNSTKVEKMNSRYSDKRFLNIFSDNEARLFFSSFILFVEGVTELEVFGNFSLLKCFPILKKVDVYQNNDVTLKCTNPSYANLSIPYLVLYDADKLINYDIDNQVISFSNTSINIKELYERVRKSYYGSLQYDQKVSIQEIIDNGNKTYESDIDNKKYSGRDLKSTINSINSNILLPNNYMLAETTIEGSLINNNNINLFSKWLVDEVIQNVHIKPNVNISKLIRAQKARLRRNVDVSKIFKCMFCLDSEKVVLTKSQRRFIKLVKYKYLNNIKREMSKRCSNEEDLLLVYRLVFSGKTDTLVSVNNKSYVDIGESFKLLVVDTKKEYLSVLSSLMGKTGGWVTRYLDYSIGCIIKEFSGDEFNNRFKHLYPEIHAIISVASSSIE